ncbi:MAG: dihydroorotate dehydrogenase, partial [Gammaproteobacteria bacterium]|nr:dihydroorotate dehydrogenase [Gammaproteobacteria bacterium]
GAVDIPVIVIGGIMTAADALEFILVGAVAVQVGTANFVNPAETVDIIDRIVSYLVENGIDDIALLRGSLKLEA